MRIQATGAFTNEVETVFPVPININRYLNNTLRTCLDLEYFFFHRKWELTFVYVQMCNYQYSWEQEAPQTEDRRRKGGQGDAAYDVAGRSVGRSLLGFVFDG